MEIGSNLTFTLSARGGVAAFAWLDHPAGTIGYFVDKRTDVPANGFFLVPGIDRTGTSPVDAEYTPEILTLLCAVVFIPNTALSKAVSPDPSEFVVRSLWNNTHV